MRKTAIAALLLLLAVSVASAQTPSPIKLGVGAFGGLSLPLVQDDQKSGTEFGLRGRLSFTSFLSVEAQIAFTKWGQADPIQNITMPEGSKITQFGVNGLLGGGPGTGIKPFFVAGVGSYKIKNDDTKSEITRMGYSGGLGLAIGVSPKITIEGRGEAVVIPLEEAGSKKAVQGTVGLMFNF